MIQGRKKVSPAPAAGGWGAVNATERQRSRQKILIKGNREAYPDRLPKVLPAVA